MDFRVMTQDLEDQDRGRDQDQVIPEHPDQQWEQQIRLLALVSPLVLV